MSYRPTKAIIKLKSIKENVKTIISKYPNYQYYIAVVKANCYGYRGHQVVQSMIDGGANCLAASLVEEGIALRRNFSSIPILLFTPVLPEQLDICRKNNLIITVATLNQAKEISKHDNMEIMIRVNGGSDILGGPTNKEQFDELIKTIQSSKNHIKGLYLHSYNAHSFEDTQKEYKQFEKLTSDLDLSQFEMISIESSLTLPIYQKQTYSNCCRLGNIMYGIESTDSDLKSTFSLESKILSIFQLKANQHIAYDHAYTASKEQEYIATIPIGFGDGFSKTNIGRDVFIDKKRYKIVAITMDITHILVDETISVGNIVQVIADTHHLDEISNHIHGATEEAICALNDRVERIYINE